jgi:hypothetical protein
MRLSNAVALLLLAASLSPTAWASTPKKHPASTPRYLSAPSDENGLLPRISFSFEPGSRVAVESGPIPQPNPAARAIYELTGRIPGADDGGLWLSGDVEEATDRLRWIIGQQR